jgi:hypothetical protein
MNAARRAELEGLGVGVIFDGLWVGPDLPPSKYLHQDVAAFNLPDGSHVDVGWFPQFDTAGSLVVFQYDEKWANSREVLQTRSPAAVMELIVSLAKGGRADVPEEA